jgi:hypothetical protein
MLADLMLCREAGPFSGSILDYLVLMNQQTEVQCAQQKQNQEGQDQGYLNCNDAFISFS